MSYDYSKNLNPERALIWRIVHRNNVPWILDNGLYSGNSFLKDPNWVPIGNTELIDKRSSHQVPQPPFGTLNDYVPFYFTPFSPMLLNIKSGRGVTPRANEEIVILVTSLRDVAKLGLNFVFTDTHAYYGWANFYKNLADLQKLDWPLIQNRDFSRDINDPAKIERYQAEALIYQHCPITALFGMVCYNDQTSQWIQQHCAQRSLNLDIKTMPGWYF